MQRQNRRNDGLDHCMPTPVSNNNNNNYKNNGGNCNTPYNGSYNQIYTGIPQSISPDMGGNLESTKDMRSISPQNFCTPMPNSNAGMGGYSQSQMGGMQPMNFNGYQQFGQRPWMSPGPMGGAPGAFQAPPMLSYNPMPSYPVYPQNPYGAGMGWNSPMVASTMPPTMPSTIDGYPNFNGDDFKILGYGGPNIEDPTGMSFQNPQNSGNGNSGRNSRIC